MYGIGVIATLYFKRPFQQKVTFSKLGRKKFY